mmetsp:Transcript_8806/g.25379  ORF Transcript_8806/g.25379 Transcript_8806/m.25379 type:complete len:213 (+) Transcript_8806:529-1167(+)
MSMYRAEARVCSGVLPTGQPRPRCRASWVRSLAVIDCCSCLSTERAAALKTTGSGLAGISVELGSRAGEGDFCPMLILRVTRGTKPEGGVGLVVGVGWMTAGGAARAGVSTCSAVGLGRSVTPGVCPGFGGRPRCFLAASSASTVSGPGTHSLIGAGVSGSGPASSGVVLRSGFRLLRRGSRFDRASGVASSAAALSGSGGASSFTASAAAR